MTVKKSVQELLAVNDPAWPIVQKWIQSAANAAEVLPPDPDLRGQALEEIQVTVRSSLGAVVYETGGILADDGWLRVLGSGHPRLRRSLPEWNRGRSISSDALSIYPFLWSKEGKDISRCSRKPCPVEQVYELNVVEFSAQLASGRL
jgi:hypothetical protein